ncbi:MAG: hypothetical protein M3R17_02100 [Bacteroidota bacterium]|nr:hypothetical protein [Bacteroidota bacterium]
MIIEQLTYRNNHQEFLDKMKDAVVDRFVFETDENPTFDKAAISFTFRYCHAVTIYTDNGNFKLHTFMANNGIETLWLSPAEATDIDATSFVPVNAKVKGITFKDSHDGYPFRLQFKFERTKITLYAADIYDNENGLDYVINDEMILVFENEDDAMQFENAAGLKQDA